MAEPALSYLLAHIHRVIPRPILQAAFGNAGPTNYNGSTSIDKAIKERVWIDTLRDINLVGGKHKMIILNRNWKLPLDYNLDSDYYGSGYYAGAYRIPARDRDFGPITAVERVENLASYCGANAGFGGASGGAFRGLGNTVTGLSAAALSSRTYAPYNFRPRVTLLDNQTVKVAPDDRLYSSDLQLHCLIGYDLELTNAEAPIIDAARRLLLCDTKIYIYNTLDLAINDSEVSAGSEISRFKDRVLEYADQINEREELLKLARGAVVMDMEIQARLMYHMV